MPPTSPTVVVDGEVFDFLAVGGMARVHRELLPRLCDADPELRIRLVTSASPASPPPTHERIEHVRVAQVRDRLRPERLLHPVAAGIEQALRRRALRPHDAVWHATQYSTPRRWTGPRVVTVYDLIQEEHPELFDRSTDDRYRRAKARAVAAADAVVAISHATADRIADHFGAGVRARTTVIPLAASSVFGRQGPPSGRDRPYLLHVGRRTGHKAFDHVLGAHATWPRAAEVDLVTVGPPWGPDEEPGRAIRLPPVGDAELAALLRGAVALVHPSTVEGFGLPVVEALASDCPVIARRLPVTEEVAGELPLYVDFGDEADVHAAFDRALDLAGTADRTGGGVARVAAYTWDDAAERTVTLYRSLR